MISAIDLSRKLTITFSLTGRTEIVNGPVSSNGGADGKSALSGGEPARTPSTTPEPPISIRYPNIAETQRCGSWP